VNFSSSAGPAAEVVSKIGTQGGNAVAYGADVSDNDAVEGMFKQVAEDLGPVEILVNNAGITADNLLLRMSPDDFDRVLAVNLRSAFLCTRLAVKSMLKSRWGRVVSIASVAGIFGNPGQANYAASKAGLIGFTKSVAKEVGSRGITANVVAPGYIETDMTQALSDDVKKSALSAVSLGRFGQAEEVAAAVAFLASEQAGYITGQVLAVEGGLAL
jgi:3-oxoacyl-[acyl-carrier protein] reductase